VDAQREQRRRESALVAAKSKLRPLLGRATLNPDFDVTGSLDIAATVPVPELTQALEAADRQRRTSFLTCGRSPKPRPTSARSGPKRTHR